MLDVYGGFFLVLCAGVAVAIVRRYPRVCSDWQAATPDYRAFQTKFLLVYLFANAADWVQGAYMYHLYVYYGFARSDISLLFIAGYMSSWVLGTFCGPLADIHGRKKACIAYGIVYTLSCITKHFNDFGVLLLGRILGGVATSLLCSVFESWLVSEHHSRHFEEDMLCKTFSLMTAANGMVAVLSGVVAQVAVSLAGGNPVVAFDLAIICLAVCTALVLFTFGENYGDREVHVVEQVAKSVRAIYCAPCVLWTGAQQVLYESAVYIFVFLWTPTIHVYAVDAPLGLIFACFMLACSLGGFLFERLRGCPVGTMPGIFLVAAAALAVPCVLPWTATVMFALVLFEGVTGLYYPTISTLRSIYLPENYRATITNLFRLPLNAIVCTVLLVQGEHRSLQSMYVVCIGLQMAAIGAALLLRRAVQRETVTEGEVIPLKEDSVECNVIVPNNIGHV